MIGVLRLKFFLADKKTNTAFQFRFKVLEYVSRVNVHSREILVIYIHTFSVIICNFYSIVLVIDIVCDIIST